MKLIALTSAIAVMSSSAFAGAVAYVGPIMPEMIVEEPGTMGGSGLWLIPLILIALIFLVGQKECDIQSDPYCGTDY